MRRRLPRYNASSAYADEVLALADEIANPGLAVGDGWLCPVVGPVSFTDTWGAPRSKGTLPDGRNPTPKRGLRGFPWVGIRA